MLIRRYQPHNPKEIPQALLVPVKETSIYTLLAHLKTQDTPTAFGYSLSQ